MYPRTAVTTAVLAKLRPDLERLSIAQIQEGRGQSYPDRPPFSWITGGGYRDVGVSYGTAPARDGYDVPLRLYRPRALRDTEVDAPVIVFFHGGGWVQGNVVMYDPLCMHLAREVRAVVVSVDYRLAPEHRAPTAAQDAIDATRWVAEHSDALRADGSRVGLVGDSAGGNLVAVVAQQLRDAGRSPVRQQSMIYPSTDLTMSSASIDEHAYAPMLTRSNILAFREHYAPAGTDLTDPLLSPLFGRLDDLPPALVQTADLDPLRDDGIRYAEALRQAGVAVRLTNYLRVPHGFASFPGVVATGSQQRAELVAELRWHLRPADAPRLGSAG
jgi:acetyl esterase